MGSMVGSLPVRVIQRLKHTDGLLRPPSENPQ